MIKIVERDALLTYALRWRLIGADNLEALWCGQLMLMQWTSYSPPGPLSLLSCTTRSTTTPGKAASAASVA